MKTLCVVISGNSYISKEWESLFHKTLVFMKKKKLKQKKNIFKKKKKKKEKMEVCTLSMQKYQRSVVVIPNLWGLL